MHRDLLTTTATAALIAPSSSGPRPRRTPSCPSSIAFAAILTLSGFAAAPAQAQAVAIDPTTFPPDGIATLPPAVLPGNPANGLVIGTNNGPGTLKVTNFGTINVGDPGIQVGTGTNTPLSQLIIENFGSVTAFTSSIQISASNPGSNFSSPASVLVNGGALIVGGAVSVGQNGSGTLTVQNGGVVSAPQGVFVSTIGSTATGQSAAGTVNIGAPPGSAPVAPGFLNTPAVHLQTGFSDPSKVGFPGTLNFNHTSADYVFDPVITGVGAPQFKNIGEVNVLAGQTTLTANSDYGGPTNVKGGTLIVNGSIASSSMTTVSSGAVLGGSGTVGNTTINGTIAPGNGPTIGTLNVTGNYTQNAGSIYQVKVGSQSDLINITGNATINGGTVDVHAVAGVTTKTYRILTAAGGVAGTYSDAKIGADTSNSGFAFVTPLLIYDPNNVFLTMRTSFANAPGETRNEISVGTSLDAIAASGASKDDVGKVLTVLANLDSQHGLPALDQISGQPWADFGTMNTNNGMMFMNALGQQMANARGAASAGQRQALAQACEIADCDGTGPLSAWASALGGLGSVLGDGNGATLTYNFAGAAAGLDYRIDPRFLVGMGVGYTHGWEWVNSFPGQGYTDSVSVAVYGSFTQSGLLCRCAGGLRLLQQPGASPDHDPRPGPAHRHRQHRRQPVPRPDRGRLQVRRLRTRRRDHHAVRPLPDYERDAEWVHEVGCAIARPQRVSADDELAAHHHRCRSGRRHRHRRRQEAQSQFQAGLDARVCRYQPADHRGLCRRTGERLHRVRRPAGAQLGGARPLGHGQHRRGDAALPALRRRDCHWHRQPRHQPRRTLLLVRRPATRRPWVPLGQRRCRVGP